MGSLPGWDTQPVGHRILPTLVSITAHGGTEKHYPIWHTQIGLAKAQDLGPLKGQSHILSLSANYWGFQVGVSWRFPCLCLGCLVWRSCSHQGRACWGFFLSLSRGGTEPLGGGGAWMSAEFRYGVSLFATHGCGGKARLVSKAAEDQHF